MWTISSAERVSGREPEGAEFDPRIVLHKFTGHRFVKSIFFIAIAKRKIVSTAQNIKLKGIKMEGKITLENFMIFLIKTESKKIEVELKDRNGKEKKFNRTTGELLMTLWSYKSKQKELNSSLDIKKNKEDWILKIKMNEEEAVVTYKIKE